MTQQCPIWKSDLESPPEQPVKFEQEYNFRTLVIDPKNYIIKY